ncbi:Phosphatidylinositol-3,4,5-trisphosphate 3-phosphatase [Giardia muris]|uniref:Phosphatidylinositol-3,4,5-trisphosphate 3-phosphatase n=1 Tax=Giardia muris TaxID=5742 RepID=A0A4Z1SZ00_GIAMU|nr:Phosphatidylinositol-3,4,5-trisphosphate 3-phosphatase [Giardia muris]|eukprot:TNJ26893.1 Phosphatidylinositol-3,4,5-trisphosphate 3-phosphatase [Giardia muris]
MSLRRLVSKNKRRFLDDGFDLDLAYIRENLITMGYPASSVEASYRNPARAVVRFFQRYHKDSYWVFNLCAEEKRHYDPKVFEHRVCYYGFDDHCAPPLNLLIDAVNRALDIYETCPGATLAIHCKAGKGRAGTVACCVLLALQYRAGAGVGARPLLNEVLEEYAASKTYDGKAITIPSQLRYIGYLEQLLQEQLGERKAERLTSVRTFPTLSLLEITITVPSQAKTGTGAADEKHLVVRIVSYAGSLEVPLDQYMARYEGTNCRHRICPDGTVEAGIFPPSQALVHYNYSDALRSLAGEPGGPHIYAQSRFSVTSGVPYTLDEALTLSDEVQIELWGVGRQKRALLASCRLNTLFLASDKAGESYPWRLSGAGLDNVPSRDIWQDASVELLLRRESEPS